MTVNCERCGHTFTNNYLLSRHLHRIKVCDPVFSNKSTNDILLTLEDELLDSRNYSCKFCNASFKHKTHMYRHQRKCNETNMICNDIPADSQLDSIIDEQSSLNPFGKETFDHIPDSFIHEMVQRMANGFSKMVHAIYYSADAVQNHNIHLVSKKDKVVEVYNDNCVWELMDLRECAEKILNTILKVEHSYYINSSIYEEDCEKQDLTMCQFFNTMMSKKGNTYHQAIRTISVAIQQHKKTNGLKGYS
jgi:hypothetical protein